MSLPQSNIDWARYMEGLQGKVNVDVDNLTPTGKNNIAGLGMPSDRFISYPVTGVDFAQVAPADGYFSATSGDNNGQGAGVHMIIEGTQIRQTGWGRSSYIVGDCTLLIKKGQKILCHFTNNSSNRAVYFSYAEGAI